MWVVFLVAVDHHCSRRLIDIGAVATTCCHPWETPEPVTHTPNHTYIKIEDNWMLGSTRSSKLEDMKLYMDLLWMLMGISLVVFSSMMLETNTFDTYIMEWWQWRRCWWRWSWIVWLNLMGRVGRCHNTCAVWWFKVTQSWLNLSVLRFVSYRDESFMERLWLHRSKVQIALEKCWQWSVTI